jgi:hypothetical protein
VLGTDGVGSGTTTVDGTDDGTTDDGTITIVGYVEIVTILVDGTLVGNQIVGMNTGVDGKIDAGGIEMVDTCGGTGTGETNVLGTVDGTAVIGTITYVVISLIVTTGTVDGMNCLGTTTGVVDGNLDVGGKCTVVGSGETYVGTGV